jgi:hypothetical protein
MADADHIDTDNLRALADRLVLLSGIVGRDALAHTRKLREWGTSAAARDEFLMSHEHVSARLMVEAEKIEKACDGIHRLLAQNNDEQAERLYTLVRERDKALTKLSALCEHQIFDPAVRQSVWDMTGGKCYYCDVEMLREVDPGTVEASRRFHVDHMVPKSKGGPDNLVNFVPACQKCNIAKGDRHFADFLKSRAVLPQPHLRVVE